MEDDIRVPSWGLPAGSAVLGLLAIGSMFVAPMGFVIGLGAATAASGTGLVAARDDDRPKAQRLLSVIGCLSIPLALALLTLPFIFQD